MKNSKFSLYLRLILISALVVSSTGAGSAFAKTEIKDNADTDTENTAENTNQNLDRPSTTRLHSHDVCDHSRARRQAEVNCFAKVVDDEATGLARVTSTPTGLNPAQFRAAYGAGNGKISGSNRTIAIVDAYDHPNAFQDLKTYSTQFGLTQLTKCNVNNGTPNRPCFQKVNQNGGANNLPPVDPSWALEIALDVEAAHAMCQNCSILLVEAKTATYDDLMIAVDRAYTMGAKVISGSWGSMEFSGETAYDSHFNHPGVAITFSSGDAGYGTSYPAASKYVTAVGGTTLNMSGNAYLGETAWSGSGSGCSAFQTKPSFQTDLDCSNRTVVDTSAAADPSTGAAMYISSSYPELNGWFMVGGTSLASPLVAGLYALAGVPSGVQANSLPYTRGNASNLHDIISGSTGACNNSYLCTAMPGYDGPTGKGTPKGLTAF